MKQSGASMAKRKSKSNQYRKENQAAWRKKKGAQENRSIVGGRASKGRRVRRKSVIKARKWRKKSTSGDSVARHHRAHRHQASKKQAKDNRSVRREKAAASGGKSGKRTASSVA